jgi:hypothetical protein
MTERNVGKLNQLERTLPEGLLMSYPHYDCDDLIMEGADLLKVESSEEARAALGDDA